MKILQSIGWVLLAILTLDALAFVLWIASGQHPVDGFYFGAITANIIKIIL